MNVAEPLAFKLVETVEMVKLERFTPEIILATPDVPTDIAENYVRQAAIELAEDSHILRRKINIATQAGVTDYQLEPPDCTHTLKIVEVCDWMGRRYTVLPNVPCEPPCGVSITDACGGCAPGGFIARSTIWVAFTQPNELEVRPVPGVDIDLGYKVEISVAPDRDACELDEILYQRYAPTIHQGALWHIYMLPGKPWSSPQLARYHEGEFKKLKSRAQLDALVGASGANHRMTTRRFV